MDISRKTLQIDSLSVPCLVVRPEQVSGAALLLHGYGGSKDEMAGLAVRTAEAGLISFSVDLRGHGENPLPLGKEIATDVETLIQHLRQYGKVVVIGHSLGGRLALNSSADFAVGLSPAGSKEFGDGTKGILKSLRQYRVRQPNDNTLYDFLRETPVWNNVNDTTRAIVYATFDAPEIQHYCQDLKKLGAKAIEVKSFHSDIFLNEEMYVLMQKFIKEWFSMVAISKPFTLLELSGVKREKVPLSDYIVITIDAQEEYRTGILPLDVIANAIAEGRTVLRRSRAEGASILHVVHINAPGAKTFAADSPMSKIFPEYEVRDNEPLITKKLPNSFAGTDLEERVKATGKKHLLIFGFMTHMCVSTTVRAAIDRGYLPTVVASACATRALPGIYGEPLPAAKVHEAALTELSDRFAWIVRGSSDL
jgi:nicotinamidase-related amidase